MAKREHIVGRLIEDFLDRRDEGRDIREGIYGYEDGEEVYLKDIDNEIWTHLVRRNPSVGNDGKVGLVDVFIRSCDMTDVFSSQDANAPSYVARQYESSTYDVFLEHAINDPGKSIVLYGPSSQRQPVRLVKRFQRCFNAPEVRLRRPNS